MPVDAVASFVAEEALGIAVGAAVLAVPHVVLAGAAAAAVPKLSHGVSSGAQWYGERWSDLLGEAHLEWNSRRSDSLTLAGLLASMADAPVLSDTPGRARLRMVYLKGREDRSTFIAEAVAKMPGILRVSTSPYTGTVLIHYDTMRFVSLDSLLNWIVAC
jgi:hypothetical protein